MTERKYLHTFGDLVDRFSIAMLKSVFIPESRSLYRDEMGLIEHDIDVVLSLCPKFIGAKEIRAILAVMLVNREIWLNESIARQGGPEQDSRLKFTHSINGQRNVAKNILAAFSNERTDKKIDAFAADLPKEFSAWNIFQD